MSIKAYATMATIGAMILLMQGRAAEAADVKVIAATPFTVVINELGAQFERDTGHKLVAKLVSGPPGVVNRTIDAGEPFDVAISLTPAIDSLVKDGKIVADSRVNVFYAGVGVGVRAGAPKPDISSVEAFKRTLLNAKSVAHSKEGASSVYFKNLLERLGIDQEMKPRLRPMSADTITRAVPSGEAEMVVVTTMEIIGPGIELVGPVPSELQAYIRFTAGVSASANETETAKALIKFFTSPAAVVVIKANGMEPGTPP